MDTFLWWSGVAAWGGLALFGVMMVADKAIEWIVEGFWTKREFLAFVWKRLKKRKLSQSA